MAEISARPIPKSPLTTLLSLASALHNSGSTLTLRQLVSVHESLCQAVVVVVKEEDSDSSKDHAHEDTCIAPTAAAIAQRLDTHEADICQRILDNTTNNNDNEKEQLLVLQYILFRTTTAPLQGLATIVLPFLLSKGSIYSEEIREALLDALFSTRSAAAAIATTSSSSSSSTVCWLETSLAQCTHTNNNDFGEKEDDDDKFHHKNSQWNTSCRVLVRLWEAFPSSNVAQCLHDKVRSGMDLAVARPGRADVILRPLTTWILPLLYSPTTTNSGGTTSIQKETSPCMNTEMDPPPFGDPRTDQLWKHLWDMWQSQPPQTQDVADLIVTAVLCTVLPFFASLELPNVGQPQDVHDNQQQRQRPIQSKPLWNLIYSCLRRGMNNTSLSSGGFGQQEHAPNHGTATSAATGTNVATDQILRRRGLYLVRLLVQEQQQREEEEKRKQQRSGKKQSKQDKKKAKANAKTKGSNSTPTTNQAAAKSPSLPSAIWMKYCMCFEALEMENESHLIDQVWESVADLCVTAAAVAPATSNQDKNSNESVPLPLTLSNLSLEEATIFPDMTWNWISAMLSCVLLSDSPVVRKLGLYRFLNGHVGVSVTLDEMDLEKITAETATSAARMKQPEKKHSIKGGIKSKNSSSKLPSAAPLSLVSTEFILNIVLPAYDSLITSIGTNMQFEENGKIQSDNLTPRLEKFLSNYLCAIGKDENGGYSDNRLQTFMRGLLSQSTLCQLRIRTVLLVYRAIAGAILAALELSNATQSPPQLVRLPIDEEMMEIGVQSFQLLFVTGSVVVSYRQELLRAFAVMLSHSYSPKKNGSVIQPKTLLKILALYPVPSSPRQDVQPKAEDDNKDVWLLTCESLSQWLSNMGDDNGNNTGGSSSLWASNIGAACASAFVTGQLLPSLPGEWDPMTGLSENEKSTGGALALLCTLTTATVGTTTTAGELLWPAIHKGLSFAPMATAVESLWPSAGCVTRSILLLEHGCRLGALSGMGNGELVIDQQEQMMPPPPNIEALLQKAMDFILSYIRALTTWKTVDTSSGKVPLVGGLRSLETQHVTSKFAYLIGQIQTLHEAYPSSMATEMAVNEMLKLSVQELLSETSVPEAANVVKYTALAYAALSCGADPTALSTDLIAICDMLLKSEFRGSDAGISKADVQIARSVFQYAKWGALSRLFPVLLEETSREVSHELCSELFTMALDSVHATRADAMLPLFDCVLFAAQHWLPRDASSTEEEKMIEDTSFPKNLKKIISTLFTLMQDTSNSRVSMYMMNEICALIFRPRLILDEYLRLQDDRKAPSPVRDAFRKLIEMGGSQRCHISKCVISWITVGWLGSESAAGQTGNFPGLGAIPYRDDIASLLLHKEVRLDKERTSQSPLASGGIKLPYYTHDLSVVRGFLLFFISKLPNSNDGLHPKVLTEVLHCIIINLLDICLVNSKGKMLITGSDEYCHKMRAWQALCVLSRFVTDDIAQPVCEKLFASIEQNLHGQIRYFSEVFAIQCSRMHPAIFGKAYIQHIRRKDLSLQHCTSLMIIGGNLIVGRYQIDFFQQFQGNEKEGNRLHEVLAGTIPWLSSTQGFSRSIAQIMVHKLIPLVVNMDADNVTGGDNWFLRSIYSFLDENPEMKRLRAKQSKIFEDYDIDKMCTAEGVLSVPVDEGDEANPIHVVESIKRCLQEIYLEAHEKDTPVWQQVNDILSAEKEDKKHDSDDMEDETESLVNFQRKIIPLDSLNLALEETRQQSLRNATGRKKQELIVCASLIDKVPNVAGLARTAEIFAADRLIIPDKKQCKMDNFKSISVGAEEWIQIDECKEDNLLNWLREQKENGYTIVGVEQTSSSVCITKVQFPERTVLLLGKEKEGIPVEFLQEVDICVEIPQLGIIRSLNVHVSGAVSIWEYTKQMMLKAKK